MSNFITALIKMRRDARKAGPDTSGRLKEILAILNKYNYDNGITPDIVANILQDLGPTFVKIGQIASQQGDYIPREYVEALMKLRSKVQPMDFDTVRSQIEKYLGKPVDALFATFSEKPLGSASVGQVHKATLFDGTVVAVKVRRPGVVDTVARDFALIEKILDQFVKGDLGGFDIKGFILELEKTSKTELDFTNEANNLVRFWENNTGRERVVVPKCYSELTCEAVLTEDFVMGNEVSDIDFINTLSNEERERIAALIADNFSTQVLTDGFYHALEGFDESGINVFQDMSTLFNQKVAPLQSFHPKGLIWYQGENEVGFRWEWGRYSHAFDLMQDSYTSFFGLEAPLPMIVSQLASYHYANNEAVIRRNLEFTAMQSSRPDARAVVTGYDYAPTFYPEAGSIHPMSKEHLGRRMSFAAQGLVYGLHDGAYTAASLKESRVADGGVYVTLNDTGDGLACDGSFLSGFCAAGADGVFVPAEAEIVAPDTVFIHAPGVEEPAAASYACALSNDDANLWATLGGEKTMPVSPFVTEAGEGFRFWQRAPWMDCEAAQSWHNMDRTEYSGYFDTWSAEGAAVAIESGSAFAGDNGLRVSAEKKRFSVSPVLTYERDGKNVRFSDQKQDWSGFSALTVQVRNTGKAPVTVEALRLVNAPRHGVHPRGTGHRQQARGDPGGRSVARDRL